jgi:hypothetical protein
MCRAIRTDGERLVVGVAHLPVVAPPVQREGPSGHSSRACSDSRAGALSGERSEVGAKRSDLAVQLGEASGSGLAKFHAHAPFRCLTGRKSPASA